MGLDDRHQATGRDIGECPKTVTYGMNSLNPMEFFPKWSRTFIEFSDFGELRESDKSLKHELGLV